MCAIVDANVVAEVFGRKRPPAGAKFFDWINGGNGRLVVGGRLLEELDRSSEEFKIWRQGATLAGRMRVIDPSEINARTRELQNEGKCASNDLHVLALAQVSGARLLYSNDRALQRDFKNKNLIDRPRGKVYSTLRYQSVKDNHKRLLRNDDLCPAWQ